MGDDMKGQAVRRYWMIGAAVLAVILAAGILLAAVFWPSGKEYSRGSLFVGADGRLCQEECYG